MSDLERALSGGGELAEALLSLGDAPVSTEAEADALFSALDALPRSSPPCGKAPEPAAPATDLYMLASLFQRVATRPLVERLHSEGTPRLIELFDRRLGPPAQNPEDLVFLLKILAMYPSEAGLERIVSAAQSGLGATDPLWSVIFRLFDHRHPQQRELIDALREPLPRGFAAVAYLDFCNAIAYELGLDPHPFDGAAGTRLLGIWLGDPDPRGASFAHSAAASLPFLGESEARGQLVDQALDHGDERVRLEAAWAAGKLGDPRGVERLAAASLDPRISNTAQEFLAELGRGDAVAPETQEPTFAAQVELCAWLAHPHEYGRPPETLELLDRRRLSWPPTGDARELWLFSYCYAGPHGKKPAQGVGCVGSVTFALFGETSAAQDPLDIYGLHCCWELQRKGDPRAPEERTIAAGRRLLEAAQAE